MPTASCCSNSQHEESECGSCSWFCAVRNAIGGELSRRLQGPREPTGMNTMGFRLPGLLLLASLFHMATQSGAVRLHPELEMRSNGAGPEVQPSQTQAQAEVSGVPHPPKWPDVYTVSFEVSLPYLYFSQPQGLRFPVAVWYNRPKRQMRMEIMHGLDTTITSKDIEYTLYPRINETRCGVFEHGPNGEEPFDTFLPDLQDWSYGGTIDSIDGRKVHMWMSQYREGTKVSQYTFYTYVDGTPLKFLMAGVQFFTGGHFDEYNYDFLSYTPSIVWPDPQQQQQEQAAGEVHSSGGGGGGGGGGDGGGGGGGGGGGNDPFTPPSICQSPSAERLTRRHPLALMAHALAPRVRAFTHEDAYHVFARAAHDTSGTAVGPRAHASHGLYERRLDTFKSNVDKIHVHNSDTTKGFTMRLNQWADWEEEEWRDLMLPNKARKAAMQAQGVAPHRQPLGVFQPRLSRHQLPAEVDWRGTGADAGVKDQGMCGSCFAFAATATMEGAWYVGTGQRRSFSEQQLLDCSWDYPGSQGCGGGDYQPAILYVAENGGIALEQEYPYLSNSDFCRAANTSKPGQFKGYLEISNRDELALMEAVATLGPIAVAVDAEWETFRFYAEGVYTDARCRTASGDLDHAVVLFGYGTTPEGVDYWLVRNTWSKFYGDDGHLKIKRGADDCGISSDPASAVVHDKAVVAGMAAVKTLEAVRKW